MKSFWKRRSCLFAVALAAGGGGAVLELQASSFGALSGPPVVSRAIQAFDFISGSLGWITENGDGTASTNVGAYIGPTTFLGVVIFDNPDYTISTDIQPGQPGQGTGSGSGHFTMEDVYAFDFVFGQFVGPYDVTVDIAVADTTNLAGYSNNGVTAQMNPFTGETSIVRQTVIGNQAWGDTAGSLSIFVDDGSGAPGLVADSTGVYGLVQANTVHTVEQIH